MGVLILTSSQVILRLMLWAPPLFENHSVWYVEFSFIYVWWNKIRVNSGVLIYLQKYAQSIEELRKITEQLTLWPKGMRGEGTGTHRRVSRERSPYSPFKRQSPPRCRQPCRDWARRILMALAYGSGFLLRLPLAALSGMQRSQELCGGGWEL